MSQGGKHIAELENSSNANRKSQIHNWESYLENQLKGRRRTIDSQIYLAQTPIAGLLLHPLPITTVSLDKRPSLKINAA